MAGIAKITLVGNIGKDPEVAYTPNGKMNLKFSLAVNRRRGGQDDKPAWFNITVWGGLAETMYALTEQGSLVKGKQVLVMGRFEPREYESNGQTRTALDVSADEVQLLGSRESGGGADILPF